MPRYDRDNDEAQANNQGKNAGLNRREEKALNNENVKPWGKSMTAQTIKGRVEGDPLNLGRDEYFHRH